MGTANARQRVVGVFRAARPLNTWLDKRVGPARD
jgi:hypothetical protein